MKHYKFQFVNRIGKFINELDIIRCNCNALFIFFVLAMAMLFIVSKWFEVIGICVIVFIIFLLSILIVNLIFLFRRDRGVTIYKNQVRIVPGRFIKAFSFKTSKSFFVNDIKNIEFKPSKKDENIRRRLFDSEELMMNISNKSKYIIITLVDNSRYVFCLDNNEDFILEINKRVTQGETQGDCSLS